MQYLLRISMTTWLLLFPYVVFPTVLTIVFSTIQLYCPKSVVSILLKEIILLSDVLIPDQRYVGVGTALDPEQISLKFVPLMTLNCSPDSCVVDPVD